MINVESLIAQYGSPLYVYDLSLVREAYHRLRQMIPEKTHVYYSLKANPHPAIVRYLGQLGCRTEISSRGELRAVLEANCPTENCLYTGPGKTLREITAAIQKGVTCFSVDSPVDLNKVSHAAQAAGRPVRVLLRINPARSISGAGLTMTGLPSQFGADVRWIKTQPEAFAGSPWARLIGFHVYMGTNIADSNTLLHMFELACSTTREVAALLQTEPEIIDLGGGFGHPFARSEAPYDFSELLPPLQALLDAHWPGWRVASPQIAFETGRFLVACSGTLYSTVEDVKWSQGHPFVIVDTGIHHLGGMAGLRRIPSVRAELWPMNEAPDSASLKNAHVVGPLCTPLDYLAHGVELPDLSPGDILAIRNVGAYGLTGSLIAFLSHDPPAEVFVDGEEFQEASRLKLIREYKERYA